MAWVIYKTAGRRVTGGARQTESEARTLATALGTGYASIEVDDGALGTTLPVDFQRGLYYVSTGGILTLDPPSGVAAKRIAVLRALSELDTWSDNLDHEGQGQSSAVRALSHDIILGQRKALYLRATAAAATAMGVQVYSGQIGRGPSGITSTAGFFRLAASLNKGTWSDGDPLEWAVLLGAAASRRTLQVAVTAAPTDFLTAVRNFSAIDLGTDAWVMTAITS